MDVIEILQGVMLLVGYCTLVLALVFGIAAIVVQFFAWLEVLNIVLLFGLRILQPKVIASAPAVTKLYAKSEASQIRNTVSFPKLYIAYTGYYVACLSRLDSAFLSRDRGNKLPMLRLQLSLIRRNIGSRVGGVGLASRVTSRAFVSAQ
jgi:hypothetical protein